MDSVGTTLNLLDLTLLPMEEESGPDSVLISEAEGRKNLESKRERRKKLPAEREPKSWDVKIARNLRKGEKRKLKKNEKEEMK
ncbi:hypothetical protein HID58_048059 [Brassica napus]|uniref:Uncharacterized protein n=1 Tax=Brassica napus TaxID=3708 RepID=A0ABQ8B2J7_BRANA|nr:hypothetical protein HID58_048059 [Brassica napus]